MIKQIKVYVGKRTGVLNPEEKAILAALHRLNFNEVKAVSVKRLFTLYVDSNMSDEELNQYGEKMGEMILANAVVEDYTVEIS